MRELVPQTVLPLACSIEFDLPREPAEIGLLVCSPAQGATVTLRFYVPEFYRMVTYTFASSQPARLDSVVGYPPDESDRQMLRQTRAHIDLLLAGES